MASESTDEPVTVSLPPELAEWVTERAADRDVDRETVLVQLLLAHRAAADVTGDSDVDDLADAVDLSAEVRSVIDTHVEEIAAAVGERLELEPFVSEALEAQRSELTEVAADRAAASIEDDLTDLEDDFMAKVEDVRERVIQVKREADGKASADHDHPALDARLDGLEADVEDLAATVDGLEATLDERVDDAQAQVDDLEETVWDVQEKLQTVAYVLKELREDTQLETKRATSVEQIKRRAAELDVDRAVCEACGEGVAVALLTDPECPHCDGTINDVEPASGYFSKPHLVKAKGIEAGDDEDA
jgi:predicted  nucleic acid-binding Zn-ribbon protein